MQASHDAHGTVLDGIEDRLTSHEIKSAASLVCSVVAIEQELVQQSFQKQKHFLTVITAHECHQSAI